jgi:hypothetical protein
MHRRAVAAVLSGAVVALVALVGAPPAQAADDAALQLAQKYAPVVVVREQSAACADGEPYVPTAVETVLGNPDVTLRGPDGTSYDAPTAADLAGKGEGWYLDLPGNPLDPGCDYDRWFRETAAGTPATVYARVTTEADAPDKLVLQYWMFWVFNDWNDKHEGDWEMIQLVFPARTAQEALAVVPESTAFAQHEGSEVARWTDDKVHRDGDHIAVYPGQGSHAAYYTQARWFGKSAAAGFGCDNTLAMGREVRPEVVLLPDSATGEFAWLSFTGRWGQKAPSFNNGPTGPNTKTQWTEPVQWQAEEGRPDAVPLPTIGGPAVTGFCSLTEAGSLLFVQLLNSPGIVLGVIVALVMLLAFVAARTDFFNDDDPTIDRRRKAGQIAVASLDLMRKRPGAFWVPGLIVMGSVALNLLVARILVRAQPGQDLTDVNGLGEQVTGVVLTAVVSVLLLPVVAFAMATTVEIVDALAQGREISGPTAFQRVLVHPGGWVVAILAYLVVTLLASTWWLLPVALYLLARWAVALPATELEDEGVRAGLRRSSQITKGHRIRAALLGGFLVWLAFSLPASIGAIVLLVTGWPFWATNLIALVVAAVLVPAATIGLTMLYYDLRIRHDAPEAVPSPAG